MLAEQPRILLLAARIAAEVLVGTELGRIDEDRRGHVVGAPPGFVDQRQMTRVQRPHGRNEG